MEKEFLNFHKAIEKLSDVLNMNIIGAFQEFLEYAIAGHSLSIKKDMSKHSRQVIACFYHVYRQWILLQNEMITNKHYEWFDVFGTYFETYSSEWSRRKRGQFFTPPSLCNMMARMVVNMESKGLNIPDPACGSGRLLLASHACNPKNFHFGSDIDYTCCLMSALNMMIHGIRGEVVWQNALDLSDWRQGWLINPNIALLKGIPHIEVLEKENSVIYYNSNKVAQDVENEEKKQAEGVINDFFKNSSVNIQDSNKKTNLDF